MEIADAAHHTAILHRVLSGAALRCILLERPFPGISFSSGLCRPACHFYFLLHRSAMDNHHTCQTAETGAAARSGRYQPSLLRGYGTTVFRDTAAQTRYGKSFTGSFRVSCRRTTTLSGRPFQKSRAYTNPSLLRRRYGQCGFNHKRKPVEALWHSTGVHHRYSERTSL